MVDVVLQEHEIDLATRFYIEHILMKDIEYPFYFPYYFNHSDYADVIVSTLKNQSKLQWFSQQSGSWNKAYKAPFAELLTSRGFGFSFNILDFAELYRSDE